MASIPVNQNNRVVSVTATSDGQTDFDFDFLAFTGGQLSARHIRSSDGAETDLTFTTDFTASGLGNANGGTISLIATTIVISDKVVIFGDTPIQRTADFQQSGDFFAETVNTEEDLQIMMSQEQQRDIGRSLKTPITGGNILDLPAPEATRALVGNATGNGYENGPTTDEISNAQGYAEAAKADADRIDLGDFDQDVADTAAAKTAAEVSQTAAAASAGEAAADVVTVTGLLASTVTASGIESLATSVAGLTDPTTLTIDDFGRVSGSGLSGVDGLYQVYDDGGTNAWQQVSVDPEDFGLALANVASARQQMDAGLFINGAFDSLPTPYALYGMHRLRSDYTGPLFDAERDTDSATVTVYPRADGKGYVTDIDTDFDLGEDWRLTKMYDQSGNGRHATANASANQPHLYKTTGDIVAGPWSTASGLTIAGTASLMNGVAGVTVGMHTYPDPADKAVDTPAIRIMDSSATGIRFDINRASGTNGAMQLVADPFTGSEVTVTAATAPDGWLSVIGRADWANGTMTLRQNGVDVADTFTAGTGTTDSGADIQLFNRPNLNRAFFGSMSMTVAIFDTALSSGEMDVLDKALRVTAPEYGNELLAKFGFITDLHNAKKDEQNGNNRFYRDTPAKLAAAVTTFNAENPPIDAILLDGDLTEASGDNGSTGAEVTPLNVAEVKAILDDADCEEWCVNGGNHDTTGNNVTKAEFLSLLGVDHDVYGSHIISGVRIIRIDTNYFADDDNSGYDTVSGWDADDIWLPPSQRKWLRRELKKDISIPTLVMSHHPFGQPDSDGSTHQPKNSDVIRGILEESGAHIIGVLQGHRHVPQLRVVNGIPYFRFEAMVDGEFSNGDNAYAVLNVYRDHVEVVGYGNQPSYNGTAQGL